MFENMDRKEIELYRRMFACEHSTLTTILTATIGQIRDLPLDTCHPSMAATLMAINSLKASITAAQVHNDTKLADLLQRMYEEVLEVIYNFHQEGAEDNPFNRSQDIPDVFKKAFEKE